MGVIVYDEYSEYSASRKNKAIEKRRKSLKEEWRSV
jgi:hypothetical protein|nr:MAG TPA: hypothetical protein [Caudoviricetes sp.]